MLLVVFLRTTQSILHDQKVGPLNPKLSRSMDLLVSTTATESFISTEGSTVIMMMSDLEPLLKQVFYSNSFVVMFTTPGNFYWLCDSACCNHMNTNVELLSSSTPVSFLPSIHAANSSHASTFTLNFPETYCISKLILNFIFISQLCENELNSNFFSFDC